MSGANAARALAALRRAQHSRVAVLTVKLAPRYAEAHVMVVDAATLEPLQAAAPTQERDLRFEVGYFESGCGDCCVGL